MPDIRADAVRAAGADMSWLRRLGAAFLFVTLELGALFGVPIPPEKIREITDLMHRPHVTDVRRDDTEEPDRN